MKKIPLVTTLLLLFGAMLVFNNCGSSGGNTATTTTSTTIGTSTTSSTNSVATTSTTTNSGATNTTSTTTTTTTTTTTSTSTTSTTLIPLNQNNPTATLRTIDDDWIPFAYYNINEAAGYIELFTSEARIASVKVLYAPFLVHADPFSGHHSGKTGMDWLGYVASQESELTSFGQTVGILKTKLETLIPYYISPVDNLTITDIIYNPASQDQYFGEEEWIVKGNNGYVEIYYDHMRKLHPNFISQASAAGNVDLTALGSLAQNENLLSSPFTLNEGDNVGQPQVLGQEVFGNTDYWTSSGNDIPHLQIEGSMTDPSGNPVYNIYWLISEEKRNSLMTGLYNTIAKAALEQADIYNSWLNDGVLDGEEFWWRAEVSMEPSSVNIWDNTSVFAGNQTWYEVRNATDSMEEINSYTPGDSLNNDSFTIFPINKDPRVFKASLYSSANVNYLVQKQNFAGGNSVGPYVGEVLENSTAEAASGQLLIHWKFYNDQILAPDTYQAASYSLDTTNYVLKMRWGSVETSVNNISILPIPISSDTVNGTTIVQYKQDGFYSSSIYGFD